MKAFFFLSTEGQVESFLEGYKWEHNFFSFKIQSQCNWFRLDFVTLYDIGNIGTI